MTSQTLKERLDRVVEVRTAASQQRVYQIGDVLPAGQFPLVEDIYRVDAPVAHRWYVVNSKPGCDSQAAKSLKDAGMKAFLPLERYWVVEHRREVAKMRSLFPRYLFAGLPVNERNEVDTYAPKMCDGVVDLLRWNGAAVSFPDTVIGDLMLADQRRGQDFIWDKACKFVPKKMRTPEMKGAMDRVLEASPSDRMNIFLGYFGTRKQRMAAVDSGHEQP